MRRPDETRALGIALRVGRNPTLGRTPSSPDEPRTLGIREKSYGMRFRVRSLSQDEPLALGRVGSTPKTHVTLSSQDELLALSWVPHAPKSQDEPLVLG